MATTTGRDRNAVEMADRPTTVTLVLVCASRPSVSWTIGDVDVRALCLASPVFSAMFDGAFLESRLDTARLTMPLDPETPHDVISAFVRRCQGHGDVLDATSTLWLWDALAFVFIDMIPFTAPLVGALTNPHENGMIEPALVIGAHVLHACPVRGQVRATLSLASAASAHFDVAQPFARPRDDLANRVAAYTSFGDAVVRTWSRLSCDTRLSMAEKAVAWLVGAQSGLLAAAATTVLADWHRPFARLDAHTRVPFILGTCRPLHADARSLGSDICLSVLAACVEDDDSALVDSHDAFSKALADDSPTVIRALAASGLFGDPNVVIAGGAAINAVQAPRLRRRLATSDVDLWIVGPDAFDRRRALDRVVRTLFDALPGCRGSHRGSVVTIETAPAQAACAHESDPRAERVQIILTDARSGAEVVSRFDLAHVCGWYDADGVGLLWPALWAIVTRRTRALPGVDPIASRLSKAASKGFDPVASGEGGDDDGGNKGGGRDPMYTVDNDAVEWHTTADNALAQFAYMPIRRSGDPRPSSAVTSPFVPHARRYIRYDDGHDAFDEHGRWRGFALAQPTRIETTLLTVLASEDRAAPTPHFTSTPKRRLTVRLGNDSPLWSTFSNADAQFFERVHQRARADEHGAYPDNQRPDEPLPSDPLAAFAVALLRHCHPDPVPATDHRQFIKYMRARCRPTLTRCPDGGGHSFAVDCTPVTRLIDGLTGETCDVGAIAVGSCVALTVDIAGGMWSDPIGGRLMLRLISARVYPPHMHRVLDALSALPLIMLGGGQPSG
ncbi:hypothetical protein psal_cds_825 [Pandoravirus salinus]|uniref:Uncharacterized protein n=1 Tax=Pandoravirus salinus TaxID=1349410 RepID=S4VZC5_9VIRU|nr:hypothetical protein psal_cds_825 [Pandoravirus salinus]AGO84861.1 hypothetical protein psal_cds_825 [Pandoravirus salinus]